ncbi:histidine phosphatase family protein [uncultured Roseivirga sp.]|uniref:SixA phosphatase family protein n=1 Tax=uncultured Roseivirga sp. TaxID=543088 RepID=UPI0030DC09B3|tara:strand:+ start:53178 stop:53669 length:492 start_codon:yes stop_codon:yes gene_type:complete
MVRNLLLIRHADAISAGSNQRDFERKLSEKGKSESALLGEYIKNLPFEVDTIYTSPSVRTLQTCAEITQQLERAPRIISSEEYYEATGNVMFAAVNRIDDIFKNVAIIAHNPSISYLYEYLSGDSQGGFLTASCAWLQISAKHWNEISGGMAQTKDYYYPGMS